MKVNGIELKKKYDTYSIDPRNIKVKWENNIRGDYGDPESWQEHVEGLKIGIKNDSIPPLRVRRNVAGELELTHGYRRQKGFLQLINEGFDVGEVRIIVEKVDDDETILLNHLFLNNGKNLNSVELADLLNKLHNAGHSFTDLAKKTGFKETKVRSLINFEKNAAPEIKEDVAKKEMTFSAANKLVIKTKDKSEQVKIVDSIKESGKKVTTAEIKTNEEEYKENIKKDSFDDMQPTELQKHTLLIAVEEMLQEIGHDIELPSDSAMILIEKLQNYGLNITKFKK